MFQEDSSMILAGHKVRLKACRPTRPILKVVTTSAFLCSSRSSLDVCDLSKMIVSGLAQSSTSVFSMVFQDVACQVPWICTGWVLARKLSLAPHPLQVVLLKPSWKAQRSGIPDRWKLRQRRHQVPQLCLCPLSPAPISNSPPFSLLSLLLLVQC